MWGGGQERLIMGLFLQNPKPMIYAKLYLLRFPNPLSMLTMPGTNSCFAPSHPEARVFVKLLPTCWANKPTTLLIFASILVHIICPCVYANFHDSAVGDVKAVHR